MIARDYTRVVAPRITAAEFRALMADAIEALSTSYDTAEGPIPDVILSPYANVAEAQRDTIRRLGLLLTLQNLNEFSSDEVDASVYNASIRRLLGSFATGEAIFFRNQFTTASLNVSIPRGYPIGTGVDPTSQSAITFYTAEAATMLAASASSYFQAARNRFEIAVPIICLVSGKRGEVGPNRITRNLRALPTGIDGVTNLARTGNGNEIETNEDVVERYFLSSAGQAPTTVDALTLWLRTRFATAQTTRVVYGTDPALLRGETTPNAVDVYVREQDAETHTETMIYLGPGVPHVLLAQPTISLTSISVGTSADWALVKDTTNDAQSSRGADAVVFNASYAGTVGSTFVATYVANNLISDAQSLIEQNAEAPMGADVLFKQGTEVPLYITIRLRARSGASYSTIVAAVRTLIATFVSSLSFAASIEESDVNAAIRALSGVDNVLIDRMSRDPAVTTNTDFTLDAFEYPSINENVNLVITPL